MIIDGLAVSWSTCDFRILITSWSQRCLIYEYKVFLQVIVSFLLYWGCECSIITLFLKIARFLNLALLTFLPGCRNLSWSLHSLLRNLSRSWSSLLWCLRSLSLLQTLLPIFEHFGQIKLRVGIVLPTLSYWAFGGGNQRKFRLWFPDCDVDVALER